MISKETYTEQILNKLDRIDAVMSRIQKEEQERREKQKRENSMSFGAKYAKEYSKKFE